MALAMALAGCRSDVDRAVDFGPGVDDLKRSPCSISYHLGRGQDPAIAIGISDCVVLPQAPGPISL